jgi:peptidoglycan/xylan/chitin deacetylase (PgdA/CDA1 family)
MLKSIRTFVPLVSIIIFIDALVTIIIAFSFSITTFGQLEIQKESSNNKVVILTFGNAPKSQYNYAKPILDNYGFKASFFVVCDWIPSDKDDDSDDMTWQDIETLYNEGHDIETKSLNHKDLTKLSASELDFEIGQSKKCLADHNIDAKVFGTPYGEGWDNSTVIDTIAKYYDFAITGFSDLMYLNCDGWNEQEEEDYKSKVQTDRRTYFDDGTLTYANRYSIREWSHDSADKEYLDNDQTTLEEFVQVVNSQDNFNKNATIKAIPIIAYHDLDYGERISGSTYVNLFDAEMKYLHDNSFTVLTMADLGYDESTDQLYIKPLD